jgi:hypothetical protein
MMSLKLLLEHLLLSWWRWKESYHPAGCWAKTDLEDSLTADFHQTCDATSLVWQFLPSFQSHIEDVLNHCRSARLHIEDDLNHCRSARLHIEDDLNHCRSARLHPNRQIACLLVQVVDTLAGRLAGLVLKQLEISKTWIVKIVALSQDVVVLVLLNLSNKSYKDKSKRLVSLI